MIEKGFQLFTENGLSLLIMLIQRQGGQQTNTPVVMAAAATVKP